MFEVEELISIFKIEEWKNKRCVYSEKYYEYALCIEKEKSCSIFESKNEKSIVNFNFIINNFWNFNSVGVCNTH